MSVSVNHCMQVMAMFRRSSSSQAQKMVLHLKKKKKGIASTYDDNHTSTIHMAGIWYHINRLLPFTARYIRMIDVVAAVESELIQEILTYDKTSEI